MSKQTEALKLALEALENWLEFDPENFGEIDKKAITALREALAEQPAQRKPMTRATIADARDCLNTNDKAMWVLGWNECVEAHGIKENT